MAYARKGEFKFNDNWKFCLGDFSGAEIPEFNDNNWRKLTLPHDWSIEGEFDRSAPTLCRGGFLPAGIGWYRKNFYIPAGWKGKLHCSEIWRNFSMLRKFG